MRLPVLAAVIAAMLGLPAAATMIQTEGVGPLPAKPPGPGAAPMPVIAVPARPACTWRIAFRPPARLYFGCRWPDTLATSTQWVDLDPGQRETLVQFAAALARGDGTTPLELPDAPAAGEPSQCDRFWLWAEDEGTRAPRMTRARKLEQACGDEALPARGN
jgi:hypothetical protein